MDCVFEEFWRIRDEYKNIMTWPQWELARQLLEFRGIRPRIYIEGLLK